MIGRARQFTQAGGAVAIATGEVIVRKLILTPGAAAATCDIKEKGTGGTVVLSLSAPANGPSTFIDGPIAIQDPYLSAIAGAGASLTVVM
jgi:hypothetical protein